MSWSYTSGSGTTLDRVRFAIGDTNSSDHLLSNEEITDISGQYGSDVDVTAQMCCLAIVAKLSRDTTTSNQGTNNQRREKVENYKNLYEIYKSRTGLSATMMVGGVSLSEADDFDSDTSIVQPSFKVGMDDNIGSAPPRPVNR